MPKVPRSIVSKFDPRDRVTTFLNVDLELAGRFDASLLVDELSKRLFTLYAGRDGAWHRAYYEVRGQARDADRTILALAKVVNGLSPAAKRQWRRLRTRRFNIGTQAGLEPLFDEAIVGQAAIAAVAALHGELALTTYAPQLNRKRRPPSAGLFVSQDPQLGDETRLFAAAKR